MHLLTLTNGYSFQACHTHSPKAGQGMNVSMMDSFNLSWKLVHSINGLSPKTADHSDPILSTFGQERLTVARQLIDFDTKFSSMFSGRISDAAEAEAGGLTHEEFLEIFLSGSGFTSGCGIEYPESQLVRNQCQPEPSQPLIAGTDYLGGNLKPGRRVNDCIVTRYADANPRHIQDGECEGVIDSLSQLFCLYGATNNCQNSLRSAVTVFSSSRRPISQVRAAHQQPASFACATQLFPDTLPAPWNFLSCALRLRSVSSGLTFRRV